MKKITVLTTLLLFIVTTNVFSISDFSHMNWTEAFDALHAELQLRYPLGDWKGIDWQALNAEFRPRIAEAEANNDIKAYYLALCQYTYSFPDGHVGLEGDDLGLKAEQVGGGYGLAITGLDDGRVIAHIVLADGPAAEAGLEVGAEILEWNGQPIEPALSQVKFYGVSNLVPTPPMKTSAFNNIDFWFGRLLEQKQPSSLKILLALPL